MKRLAAMAAAAAFLTLASQANARTFTARSLSDSTLGTSRAELAAQHDFSTRVLRRLERPAVRWRLAPRHRTCWARVPWSRTCDRARRVLILHRRLLARADARLGPSTPAWLAQAFECIHSHEGDWDANTGNGYYGGLQEDLTFQRTYGPEFVARWGTADRWPPSAQITAAARAYASGRGFGPWPNTAAMCGLS